MNLKTTAEERASGRDLFAEDWDPADVQDAPTRLLRALDDIDTLLAEVERLRIRCRLASTTLEFVRGAWVPAGDEDALALVTYATSPSPETGHVGWCWWAKGKMGDAGSLEGAMLRAERALEAK